MRLKRYAVEYDKGWEDGICLGTRMLEILACYKDEAVAEVVERTGCEVIRVVELTFPLNGEG